MKIKVASIVLIIATLLFINNSSLAAPLAEAMGTTFTYQGRLDRDGQPFTGNCDFEFSLYDAASVGSQVGPTLSESDWPINNGFFTVQLDFGNGSFNGEARWLQVAVACPGDGELTAFPRQPLTASPYALFALTAPWQGLTGMPGDFADEIDNDTTYTNGSGLTLTDTTFSIDPSYTQRRVSSMCPADSSIQSINEDGTVTCETDDGSVFTIGNGLNDAEGVLSIDPTYTQRRISSTCIAGSSIQSIAEDGTVTCETDDNTTYISGNGLGLDGTTFSINPSYTQQRVSSACVAGSSIQAIAEDGTVTCESDDNTTYSGENGVTLTDTTFSVDRAYVQLRVNDGCPTGSSIQTIDTDGNVTCETDDGTVFITGGGVNLVDGTLSIDPSYTQRRVSTACTTGSSIQAIAEDGTVTCETDDNTTYSAGSGLGLSDTTFSINPAYTQRRISSSCVVGSSIWAIQEDGSVYCNGDAPLNRSYPPLNNTDTIVVSSGSAGFRSSATIGIDGLPLISFEQSSPDSSLGVVHCNDLACSSYTSSILDTAGNIGNSSIIIGRDGLGLIAYRRTDSGDLKVAHCRDTACTSADIFSLVYGSAVNDPVITLVADGFGLIAFQQGFAQLLGVIHCTSYVCNTFTSPVYLAIPTSGNQNAIATGVDGYGLISFRRNDSDDLYVTHCTNPACSTSNTYALDTTNDTGYFSSLVIGADGRGLISYIDQTTTDLRVAHCNTIECSSASLASVADGAVNEVNTAITIGSDNLGLITLYDSVSGNVKVAHCDNTDCSSVLLYNLTSASGMSSGTTLGLTMGVDGFGLFSYYEPGNQDLKVLHCANVFCAPLFRRR